MILTLIAILALALLGAWLVWYSGETRNGLVEWTCGVVGCIACLAAVCLLIVYAVMVSSWIGAKYKADIVNREYGTTYTQAEMFYAGEVIDVVRELDRKRYELTVNKGEPAP